MRPKSDSDVARFDRGKNRALFGGVAPEKDLVAHGLVLVTSVQAADAADKLGCPMGLEGGWGNAGRVDDATPNGRGRPNGQHPPPSGKEGLDGVGLVHTPQPR
jgi:hypothetical protein